MAETAGSAIWGLREMGRLEMGVKFHNVQQSAIDDEIALPVPDRVGRYWQKCRQRQLLHRHG